MQVRNGHVGVGLCQAAVGKEVAQHVEAGIVGRAAAVKGLRTVQVAAHKPRGREGDVRGDRGTAAKTGRALVETGPYLMCGVSKTCKQQHCETASVQAAALSSALITWIKPGSMPSWRIMAAMLAVRMLS